MPGLMYDGLTSTQYLPESLKPLFVGPNKQQQTHASISATRMLRDDRTRWPMHSMEC